MRPYVHQKIVCQVIYAFTAIAPITGDMISLILPTASSVMMSLFLQQVSQAFSDKFLVMQVDRASWHSSQQVQVPENIRLIFQPPYSPEVNPVEHIWEEIREKHFANRLFSSLDETQEHLCITLNELSSKIDHVVYIAYFPHISVACEKAN